MTIETEATPRPWSIKGALRPTDGDYDCAIAAVIDGKPRVIGEAFGRVGTNARANAQAKAALIVRAVNSLDALVALRNEVAALQPFENAIREAIGNTNYTCLMHRLKAALASGEGK